jgi:hypothetical protein
MEQPVDQGQAFVTHSSNLSVRTFRVRALTHRSFARLINDWLKVRLTKLRDDVSLGYFVRSAGEVRP